MSKQQESLESMWQWLKTDPQAIEGKLLEIQARKIQVTNPHKLALLEKQEAYIKTMRLIDAG